MSCGDGGVLELALVLDDELPAPLFSAESISSSAEDNAVWSDELTLPEETSLASSCFKRSSGE
jgi:hypothetical protein